MIDYTIEGKVAVVTLRSPPVNALSQALLMAFEQVLIELEANLASWHVLHLRSAQRVFAAGADIAYMRSLMDTPTPGNGMADYLRLFQRVFARLEALPRVVLAEINGAALGGGCELALACDLRYAAHEAKIGLPEVGLGLIPGAGGTQRLTRLCGPGTAKRLVLGSEAIDGITAERLGVVQWSCPAASLADEVRHLVEKLSRLPPQAQGFAKQCIQLADSPADPLEGYRKEIDFSAVLIQTEEMRQRLELFLNKGNK